MTLLFISCSSVSNNTLISPITSKTSIADGPTMVMDCRRDQLIESLQFLLVGAVLPFWTVTFELFTLIIVKRSWGCVKKKKILTMLANMSRAGSKTKDSLVSSIFHSTLECLLFPGRLHFRRDTRWLAVKFSSCMCETVSGYLVIQPTCCIL